MPDPEKNDGLLIDLDTSSTDVSAFKAIVNLFHSFPDPEASRDSRLIQAFCPI